MRLLCHPLPPGTGSTQAAGPPTSGRRGGGRGRWPGVRGGAGWAGAQGRGAEEAPREGAPAPGPGAALSPSRRPCTLVSTVCVCAYVRASILFFMSLVYLEFNSHP